MPRFYRVNMSNGLKVQLERFEKFAMIAFERT